MRGLVRNAAPALIALVALPFAIYAFGFGFAGFKGAPSRFVDTALPLAGPSLHLHAITGAVITILAFLQVIPTLRKRAVWAHKALGLLIVLSALVTAFGGLTYIALKGTIGGAEMSAGFTLYGILMIVSAIMVLYHAHKNDRVRHGIWARRLVILALASWLYRVHYGLWYMLTDGLFSTADFTGAFDRLQNWAFFLPYLALYEIRRRRA